MLLWTLLLVMTALTVAALFLASSGRRVNATTVPMAAEEGYFRESLQGISRDKDQGRLSAQEALLARKELARELVQVEGSAKVTVEISAARRQLIAAIAALFVAGGAFAAYGYLGSPDLPSAPSVSSRPELAAKAKLDQAIAKVEANLLLTPDDRRGWQVIGPIYLQAGRTEDAVHAFRRVLELAPPTADAETDLAEALMVANSGSAVGEPMQLLTSAAARDPKHTRSRFYLAGEATRTGDYDRAIGMWNDLIAMAKGDEPWLAIARQGLDFAVTNKDKGATTPPAASDPQAAILGMVAGLRTRLLQNGGTLDEWIQLVRSELVLGDKQAAQEAFEKAQAAYPDRPDGNDLDKMAKDAGLDPAVGGQ